MDTPPNMQKRGTGSAGHRSTGSNRHRKRIWRFATDPADKVHPPPRGRQEIRHARHYCGCPYACHRYPQGSSNNGKAIGEVALKWRVAEVAIIQEVS